MELGTPLEIEKPVEDAVSRIRFAPRSNNLLISSWDSHLRLYDVDGSVLRFDAISEGGFLDCCFEDDSAALSASSDGCIRRHEFCSGTQTAVGKHDDVATCVEYSEETGQVVTAGLDKKLMFWDIRMGNGTATYTKMVDSEVGSMSLCEFHLLASAGTIVNMYDLRVLRGPLQSHKSSLDYHIQCVRTFSNCQGFMVASVDGCVALKYFDPPVASEIGDNCVFRCRPKARERKHLVAVNDLGFHQRYDIFVTGDDEGYAIIWDTKSRRRLFEFQRVPNSVTSLSFNHNGQTLAVASSYTYEEPNEVEEVPQIFIHQMESVLASSPASSPCSSE